MTPREFEAALRSGPYAWPGGYPLFFYTADGGALSFETAWSERNEIFSALRDNDRGGGWYVIGQEVNWEDPELLDSHTGERIESAYAEDDAPKDHAVHEGTKNVGAAYLKWLRRDREGRPLHGPGKRPSPAQRRGNPVRLSFDQIRAGDRVTYVDPRGQEHTGKVVMRGDYGWVLNLGGRHGTPGLVDEGNFVRATRTESSGRAGLSWRDNASDRERQGNPVGPQARMPAPFVRAVGKLVIAAAELDMAWDNLDPEEHAAAADYYPFAKSWEEVVYDLGQWHERLEQPGAGISDRD